MADETEAEAADPVLNEIETRTYLFEKAEKEMEYALYVPTSYDESKEYPLVVLLHAMKSTPQAVMRYKGILEEAEARGYVVVAPFGYNEHGWYGSMGSGRGMGSRQGFGGRDDARNRGDRRRGDRRREESDTDEARPEFSGAGEFFGAEEDPKNLGELSELDVLNVLKIVQREFNIDVRRIYLVGHAMGGGGVLHLGVSHPKIWGGLAALAPFYFTDPKVLRKSKDIPTLIVRSAEDEFVSAERVESMIVQMKRNKTRYRYLEVPEGDHYRSIAENPEMISKVYDFFEGKLGAEPDEPKALGEVYREFTNEAGKVIEASLLTATDKDVTIRRKDGKRFTLPTTSLSKEDQVYIEDWLEKNSVRLSQEAFQAAMDADPDPELEGNLIKQLELDASEPEAAVEILSVAIEEKEKAINDLDKRIEDAFRAGRQSTGRKLQLEALGINEELKTMRSLRAQYGDQ